MSLEMSIRRTGIAATMTAVLGFGVVACGSGGASDDAGSSTSATTETTTSPASGSVLPTILTLPAPFVDHVVWAQTEVGPSLQIYPTASGRRTEDPAAMDQAWAEVLALAPRADTPGMKAQFDCHWNYARAIDPDKTSWNLEPNRPVLTEQEMISARCNPGAPEE